NCFEKNRIQQMITLNKISISENGNRVDYSYSASSESIKFVNEDEMLFISYEESVISVPNSILVIPFISNWLPIAWFGGFDILVEEIDSDFFSAMVLLKNEFKRQFPQYQLNGSLRANRIVKNQCEGSKTAMLFSGGVDAYASYIRIRNKKPDLVTILGADIELDDIEQWTQF